VTQLDVFPTVCEELGIDAPPWLEGTPLGPLVRGEVDIVRDAWFGEVTYHAAYEPMRSIRTDRHLYIRRFHPQATPVGPNLSPSRARDEWQAHGLARRELPREELYDLLFDPEERVNLASDARHQPELEQYRRRLESHMRDVSDPLLKGPVPIRDGCQIFPMDGWKPIRDLPAVDAEAWNRQIPWIGFD